MYHAICKYEKFHPETYQGIVITNENKRVIKRFLSGDFEQDLNAYQEWADKENIAVERSNTIDNYIMDRFSREFP